MPALNLLIKPASGSCNLRCEYCFYRELYQARDPGSERLMKMDTLEQIMKKAMDYAQDECVIGYQGGEPTLAGLDFYRDAVRLQEQYNTRNLVIHNTIQTNGYRLDREWFPFLAEKDFWWGYPWTEPENCTTGIERHSRGGKPSTASWIRSGCAGVMECHLTFSPW